MDKNLFRKECLKRLNSQKERLSFGIDKKVSQMLYEEIVAVDARVIMVYIPLGIEVNIMPLIKKLRRQKRLLFVPFMEGESFRLVKYRLPLTRKKFGILEPKDSKQYRERYIDIAIVPMIGVDLLQRRIGFGKGMYDRFFEKEAKYIKRTIFISRIRCTSKRVLTDDYDIEADKIITAFMRREYKI